MSGGAKLVSLPNGLGPCAFTPDGKVLVSLGDVGKHHAGRKALMWDMAPIVENPEGEHQHFASSWRHEKCYQALVMAPDGCCFVVGGTDGVIHLWRAKQ